MIRIIAITVTFNDAEYLKKCIESLLMQTHHIWRIIIVDNNSNEKNKAIIESLCHERIDIIKLDENNGGAGGFELGMKYVKEKYNPDWYWIMDADAYAQDNCLENLLLYAERYENIGFVAPLIYGTELKRFQFYHHKSLSRFLDRDIPVYREKKEIQEVIEIESNSFVGPMISKKAIDKVGFVDGGLFIYGDDTEFTYRVTRVLKGLLIRDAIIFHRDQPLYGEKQRLDNWWKDYYMYRNRILFILKYEHNILKRIIGVGLVFLRCIKQINIANRTITELDLRKERKRLIFKAFFDGVKQRSGKTIDPLKYKDLILKMKNTSIQYE